MFIMNLLRRFYNHYKLLRLREYVINSHHDILSIDTNRTPDMRKYGFSFSESACFDLAHNDYRDYISTWEAYIPRVRNKNLSICDDKYLFSLVFGKYIRVPETYALINNGHVVPVIDHDINNENLYDYLSKNTCGWGG